MSRARRPQPHFTMAALTMLAASACGSLTALPRAALTDLKTARTLWAAGEPAAYEFTLEHQCFCSHEFTMPVVVTVRDGQVESRQFAATGAPVDTLWAAAFTSVDGLFDVIQDAIRRNAAYLEVTYDPQRGYPVRIDIDYRAEIADDEMTVLVRKFRPL